MKRNFFGLLCIIGFMIPCLAKTKHEKLTDCAERLSSAKTAYDAKKYNKACTILELVKVQCNGSPLMDSMLYYLGMSELKTKQYIEAKADFDVLAQDFPSSPFAIEAQFRKAQAVFLGSHPANRDQVETNEAIRLFQDFIDTYPNSSVADSARKYLGDCIEKLALKDFNNAKFYETSREYESAIIYFRAFVSEHPESKLVDQANYSIADMLVKLDRKDEANEQLQLLIDNCKDQDVLAKSKLLMSQTK